MNLRIPGPTPCPPPVLEALSRQMIDHRGPEFTQLFQGVTARLKEFFQTKNDLLTLTGSGTGGMEATIVNTLSPGDKVLSASCGSFGERFAAIAKTFGAQVTKLDFEWGRPVEPEALRSALKADPAIKAVLITHNETSTGITNDLATLSSIVREFDKLLLVDAISSISCIDLPTDAWGCDVVISGSQKGWMVPPGLVMVSVSPKAWQAHAQAKMPRFYWDFTRAKSNLDKAGQTPWTPGLTVIFGLSTALEIMAKEGLPQILARHKRVGEKTRKGIKGLGLPLFAQESHASNTVTSITVPEGVDGRQLRRLMRQEHGVVLAGGQDKLSETIFRIGHLGFVSEKDIDEVLQALQIVLPKVGFKGKGVAATA
ncbi:MAG: alanine--glyoxylate aminotransferase family protein [Chloroflexota bacterium]|nr:alanine--glyoxylate aminotransferase family protein [Chloroflexota bacterium]